MNTPLSNASEARTSHTPLPWKAVQSGTSMVIHAAYEPHGEVARISDQFPSDDGVRSTRTEYDNAVFIVRACNSHYEFLEALEWARDNARALCDVVRNLPEDGNRNALMDVLAGIYGRADAVIQKATK